MVRLARRRIRRPGAAPAAPLLPTDAVVDVVALDRSLFDAANAAKRRVHFWNGAPGTFTVAQFNPCVHLGGPFVLPQIAHFALCCPIMLGPQICNLICFPHKDMDFPPWADHALILTEKGVVGRRQLQPDGAHAERFQTPEGSTFLLTDVNAIAWDGFDVDKIEVRRYDEEEETCYWRTLANCDEHSGLFHPFSDPDPLSYALGFGCLLPCCWKILSKPTTPGLYRAKIKSDHTTTVMHRGGGGGDEVGGSDRGEITTAQISLIALARSPEDLLESLRAAKAAHEAPVEGAMERSYS